MIVFLTGATGFIGKYIKAELEKKNHKVISHSLSQNGSFKKLPDNIDIVINSAGRLGGQNASNQELTDANVNLPVALAKECNRFTIPLIHLSTPGVTGLIPDANEDQPYEPLGEYEASKVEAEKQLKLLCKKLTILRPDFVFGPGDKHKLPLFKQVNKGWFPLIGSGSAKTRPTDVRDVANAVMESFPGKPLAGGLYNIGGPNILSVKNIAEQIAVALGKSVQFYPIPRIVFKIALAFGPVCPKALSKSRYQLFGADRYCNTEKAAKKGFIASRPFAITAIEAVIDYKKQGLL